MALMGHSLYKSVSSAAAKSLWNHVPSICGYFSVALVGPQALAYAVTQFLRSTNLTQEQKSLLEPWLNMVGRLALGLVPKVHATEEGVHYHYPSLDGYSQTVSSHQKVTLSGNTLSIEKMGYLQTPEGSFEGVYESDFRLGKIYELNEERIRIQVIDKNGDAVPLLFTKVWGQYGPEIIISSENKELEQQWSQYFHPQQNSFSRQNPLLEHPKTDLYDQLSSNSGLGLDVQWLDQQQVVSGINSIIPSNERNSNFYLLPAFYALAGMVARGRIQHAALTSITVSLLSMSGSAEAGFLDNIMNRLISKPMERVVDKASALSSLNLWVGRR